MILELYPKAKSRELIEKDPKVSKSLSSESEKKSKDLSPEENYQQALKLKENAKGALGPDEDRKDYQEAIKYLKLTADAKHPKAILELGAMYSNGFGVKQDFKTAIKYIKQASALEEPLARECAKSLFCL